MIMRNFIIASVLLAASGSVLMYQRAQVAGAMAETQTLAKKCGVLEREIDEQRASLQEMEERGRVQKKILAEAAGKLSALRADHVPVSAQMPDPSQEGSWPKARPYFYLAKKHIPAVNYEAFSWIGGVTSEAAALFGMTKEERTEIDSAIQTMFEQFHQRELEGAVLTNTPESVKSQRKGAKISVFVPASDIVREAKAELAQKVNGVLGTERAGLFLERAQETEHQFDSFAKEDRVVTFVPETEDKGELIVSGKWGTSFNYYDRTRELDYMSFQYGHLLEEFVFNREKAE